MAEENNHNDAGEVAPSTVEKQAPSVAEDHAPSTDSPVATDIPSANAPDPTSANPQTNPNAAGNAESEQSAPAKPAAKTAASPKGEKPEKAKAAGDKPVAATAKKEKAPAVEAKPFAEFIQQDYLPALKNALAEHGVKELELNFVKQKVPVMGYQDDWWQIMGRWQNGKRQFNLYFPKEDIQGLKTFSCNEGSKPSTLESFLIDERKITLDLLIYGVIQRLNGQKWLERN